MNIKNRSDRFYTREKKNVRDRDIIIYIRKNERFLMYEHASFPDLTNQMFITIRDCFIFNRYPFFYDFNQTFISRARFK
jgi:hypothetical protein